MEKNSSTDISETLSAPLGDMMAAIGRGVAEAQAALDSQTIAGYQALHSATEGVAADLRRSGYQPTWYRIPEVEAEITVSLSISATGDSNSTGGGIKLYAAPIDANYVNKYGFAFNAASKVKFKIVAVPPSGPASEMRIVPRILAMSYGAARKLLAELQLTHEVTNTDLPLGDERIVERVEPPVGSVLTPGQTIVLTISKG